MFVVYLVALTRVYTLCLLYIRGLWQKCKTFFVLYGRGSDKVASLYCIYRGLDREHFLFTVYLCSLTECTLSISCVLRGLGKSVHFLSTDCITSNRDVVSILFTAYPEAPLRKCTPSAYYVYNGVHPLSTVYPGALGGEEKADDDKKEEEGEDPEIAEARREQEEKRKEKHRKMEEEREQMRQSIRDKVGYVHCFCCLTTVHLNFHNTYM